MNVIIVGNGSSLLNKPNGEVIDSFDIVVRFNNFKIKTFEKFVGTKTNYWFNTISEHKQFQSSPERIFWHTWNFNPHTDEKYKKLVEQNNKYNIPVEKTKKEHFVEMQCYMSDMQYFHYSTGALAIWMLLKEVPQVIITGFDWWETDVHHYHNNGGRGTIHDPQKEYLFIQKLISENKVKFL